MSFKLLLGDSLTQLKTIKDNQIDAVVTDPPYGLSFMGKKWDYDVPGVELWKEVFRVLKPGGHLLSFAGTRTYHRMAVNIEDAGFEIRDMISWLYGSGFPKSLNIGKQVDKMNGKYNNDFNKFGNYVKECREKLNLSRNEVEKQLGTNTALAWWEGRTYLGEHKVQLPDKNNYEKLKELLNMDNRFDFLINWQEAEREVIGKESKGELKRDMFFTQNIEKAREQGKSIGYGKWDITAPATPQAKQWEGYGTALKPACEPIVVARKPISEKNIALNVLKHGTGGINIDGCRVGSEERTYDLTMTSGNFETTNGGKNIKSGTATVQGRFPANIILDEEAGEYLGEQKRFFYCPKASKKERNFGLDDFENNKPMYESHRPNYENTKGIETPFAGTGRTGNKNQNNHPTVKPIKLMQYLVRLVTPKGAICLDPFMGSGTTGIACMKEEVKFVGIEREEEYIKIAEARIQAQVFKEASE